MFDFSKMRLRTGFGAMLVGVIAVLVVGCGGDDAAPTRPPPTQTTAPQPTATPVPASDSGAAAQQDGDAMEAKSGEIVSLIQGFQLEDLTIKVGSSVSWRNLDGPTHSSASGTSPDQDGRWFTDFIKQNATTPPITFNEAGTFAYFCTFHPSTMQATLTVVS